MDHSIVYDVVFQEGSIMAKSGKLTAIYTRVSTNQQSTRGQKAELQRWLKAQDPEKLGRARWYEDKATGKNMDRPAWQKLQEAIDAGQVNRLVVWRLDRLGRTASGLCKLFEDLQAKKVRLVSLKDAIDLGTASGRLMANMLASVAAFETEIRGERVKAGQQAAMASGKRWGGSTKGWRYGITDEQVKAILKMKAQGERITAIARTVNLGRSSIYRVLKYHQEGLLSPG